MPELREITLELRRAIFSSSLQNIEVLNNTCSTAQNLTGRFCKPAQLELYPSAALRHPETMGVHFGLCSFSLGTPTWVFQHVHRTVPISSDYI